MPASDQQRQKAIKILDDLIDEIDFAMLTTVMPEGNLRSRPMISIDQKFDGDLLFFTEMDTTKVSQVQDNPHVNVGYASPQNQQYVSISGSAQLLHNERKAETLWDPKYGKWLPEDLDVSQLGLLKVSVELAEYWDASTSRMVQIADFAKSIFGGHASHATEHGKIEWSTEGEADEQRQKTQSN